MLRVLAILCTLSLIACQNNATLKPTSAGITIRTQTSIPSTPRATVNIALPTRTIIPLQFCGGAVSPKLILYERARVTFNGERLRLRRGPSITYDMVVNLEPGDTFMVIDGPSCSEGYAWYRIQFGDVTGWIAEGDIEQYFVEPFPPG